MYDFLIIGGGVIGCALARELSRYNATVAVAEKENDVCALESRVPAAICAARSMGCGDPVAARYAALGEKMFRAYAAASDIPYIKTGCTLRFTPERARAVAADCGRYGIRFESRGACGTDGENPEEMFFPDAGMTDGCDAVYALRENAAAGGAEFIFGFSVSRCERSDGSLTAVASDGRRLTARRVINCAGSGGGPVARALGDFIYLRHAPVDMEVVRCDKPLGSPLFVGRDMLLPAENGCVAGTVGGCIPRSVPVAAGCRDAAARMAAAAGIDCSEPRACSVLRTFSDSMIFRPGNAEGVTHVLGAGVGGLTAAPAVAADYVRSAGLVRKNGAIPAVRRFPRIRELSAHERNALARMRADYAELVCAVPPVTFGEVREAVARGAKDAAGAARRLLRAGERGGVRFTEAVRRAAAERRV